MKNLTNDEIKMLKEQIERYESFIDANISKVEDYMNRIAGLKEENKKHMDMIERIKAKIN